MWSKSTEWLYDNSRFLSHSLPLACHIKRFFVESSNRRFPFQKRLNCPKKLWGTFEEPSLPSVNNSNKPNISQATNVVDDPLLHPSWTFYGSHNNQLTVSSQWSPGLIKPPNSYRGTSITPHLQFITLLLDAIIMALTYYYYSFIATATVDCCYNQ